MFLGDFKVINLKPGIWKNFLAVTKFLLVFLLDSSLFVFEIFM